MLAIPWEFMLSWFANKADNYSSDSTKSIDTTLLLQSLCCVSTFHYCLWNFMFSEKSYCSHGKVSLR